MGCYSDVKVFGGCSWYLSWATMPKSLRTCSTFGTLLYLITRYPASVSNAWRSLSCLSRFLWLASSSSITARTSNALLRITKSAIFLSNLFLVARDFVLSMAEKATCPSTTCWFSASTNRKYIACSRFVSTFFLAIKLARIRCFLFSAAIASRTIARPAIRNICLIASPLFLWTVNSTAHTCLRIFNFYNRGF